MRSFRMWPSVLAYKSSRCSPFTPFSELLLPSFFLAVPEALCQRALPLSATRRSFRFAVPHRALTNASVVQGEQVRQPPVRLPLLVLFPFVV